MDAISVEDLRYSYKSRAALNGISFSVAQGEIFGLLGPNGGGKSTAFRILSTFLIPTSGSVRVLDYDVAQDPEEIRARIGVVFQSGSLDRKLTVEENLRHQGHLYGWSGQKLRARTSELLLRFGLVDRARERAETLSGGTRRRVEIAKGILHNPALLLLDEPSTGLDPSVRLELWKYLEELRDRDGVTVLLTTHFMEEAERCDRVAILDHGALVAIGTPGELKEKIGGEVVTIQGNDVEKLRESISRQFGLESSLVNGILRIELANGHEWIPKLVNAFAGEIESITVGKPTLEDVFIHQTGHKLED